MHSSKKPIRLVMASLVVVAIAIMAVKVHLLGYSLSGILPQRQYTVTLRADFDGHDGEVRVRTFLPVSDARQQIVNEENLAPGISFSSETEGANRVATWQAGDVGDDAKLAYRFSVIGKELAYDLDPALALPETYPASIAVWLRPEEAIQVDSPEIRAAMIAIGADHGSVPERLRKIYERTSGMKQRPFKGTTDAVTALRLGEASCNGKSRLFVALARAAGIPARLIGGFVMESGSKKTSHQWLEAYVAGHWVPFDPTNKRFASLPEKYLTLYVGDEVLFKHTADINFKYRYETERVLVPSPEAKASFKYFNVWALFERLELSLLLLRTILMLPVGALVVVLFRNVIGMPTYGTFLPALLAAASGESGLFWGVLGVLIVVVIVAATRRAFHKLQLLHSPSLAILLAAVAMTLLSTSLLAEVLGFQQLAYITLFPIAVLAITAERFFLTLTEKGSKSAVRDLAGTLFVTAACFIVMSSLALQTLLIGFPEVLLIVVAMDVYLGRWVGVRLFEYLRFRRILFPARTA